MATIKADRMDIGRLVLFISRLGGNWTKTTKNNNMLGWVPSSSKFESICVTLVYRRGRNLGAPSGFLGAT